MQIRCDKSKEFIHLSGKHYFFIQRKLIRKSKNVIFFKKTKEVHRQQASLLNWISMVNESEIKWKKRLIAIWNENIVKQLIEQFSNISHIELYF